MGIEEATKTHKYQIFHPKKKSGVEILAHEIGHLDSESGKSGKIKKWISSRKSNSPEIRGEMEGFSSMDDPSIGISEWWKRMNRSRVVNLDEKNATKNGLKLLKKHGATKDELKKAKENLKLSGKTYKYMGRIYRKAPLKNYIQIKSRRTKPYAEEDILGDLWL